MSCKSFFRLKLSSPLKLNWRASIMLVFAAGLRTLTFVTESTCMHSAAQCCPYNSICTNLLILTSSPLPFIFAGLFLLKYPPVVHSISRISTSYLLHSAVYASPPPPTSTLLVVQSTGHSPIMQEP